MCQLKFLLCLMVIAKHLSMLTWQYSCKSLNSYVFWQFDKSDSSDFTDANNTVTLQYNADGGEIWGTHCSKRNFRLTRRACTTSGVIYAALGEKIKNFRLSERSFDTMWRRINSVYLKLNAIHRTEGKSYLDTYESDKGVAIIWYT